MKTSSIPLGFIDISTRPKRRQAILRISGVLSIIYAQELEYMNRIPLNLNGGRAHDAAGDSLYYLTNAIFALEEAY